MGFGTSLSVISGHSLFPCPWDRAAFPLSAFADSEAKLPGFLLSHIRLGIILRCTLDSPLSLLICLYSSIICPLQQDAILTNFCGFSGANRRICSISGIWIASHRKLSYNDGVEVLSAPLFFCPFSQRRGGTAGYIRIVVQLTDPCQSGRFCD